MTRITRTFPALVALAATVALPASAEELKFMADLTGAAEVPAVETEAMGMAAVTVDTEAMTVTWTLAHQGLSGDPVAGHFHGPASAEETAPPVVDLTVDAEETEGEAVPADIAAGSSAITEEGLQQLRDGMWYVNIHTEANPDGEIRGQVTEGEADMEAMEAMGAAAAN